MSDLAAPHRRTGALDGACLCGATRVRVDGDYVAAMHRAHASIGLALFYTAITIIVGFSILALSNFIPSIYFGLLTGLAMTAALLGSMTLLPKLILIAKPLGAGRTS